MLLSEAIILGDTLKTCEPRTWISPDGSCGCAFGGALLAAGVTSLEFRDEALTGNIADLPCVKSRWPWVTRDHIFLISQIYHKVAVDQATIEDVSAYVRTIEPPQTSSTPSPSFSDAFPQQQVGVA